MAKKTPQDELLELTQRIEAEKEEKKKEREERKRQKEAKRRKEFREKMVAPFLLVLTMLVSVLVYVFF